MPSSAPSVKARKPVNKDGTRRGAPKGHRGATYQPGPPDEEVDMEAKSCPVCPEPSGTAAGQQKRIVTGIEPEKGVRVTEFRLCLYDWTACGHHYKRVHPDCPQEGQFTPTLLAT